MQNRGETTATFSNGLTFCFTGYCQVKTFFATCLRYSRSCFSLFILIAWCRPAFSQPYSRCSKSWPSTISQKISKYGKLFRDFHPYCSGQNALFTTFIHGVQSSTPWNKSGFFKTWRAVSKNPFLLSAELNGLFTTLSTVFKKQLLSNKR